MRKRIVSLLLSLALCLTLLPTAAFAEEAQQEELLPGEQLEQVQPVPEEPEENEEQSQPDEDVIAVQAMIDALPDAAELDGMDDTALESACLAASEAYDAYDALTEGQQSALTGTENMIAILEWATRQIELLANEDLSNHTTHGEGWTAWDRGASTSYQTTLPDKAGKYYLTDNVTLSSTWAPKDGVVLCLNGKTITANGNFDCIEVTSSSCALTLCDCAGGGCITHSSGTGHGVNTTGTFNMYGGTISGNTAGASDHGGGGVYVGGTFNMYGGTISGNKTAGSSLGGGVYVAYDKTFNMNGGEITQNTANGGGGVYVVSKGKFNMTGGQITGNTTVSGGSGGGVFSVGTFTMEGGTIGGAGDKANKADIGGGVYVGSGSTFKMSGSASITGNTAKNGGGVYVGKKGTFTMESGTIGGRTGNTATEGGGVYVSDGTGSFTMTDGSITGNTADGGSGGVYVGANATFTMTDGSITGNTANTSNCGGVYVSGGTFTMNNGSITGNKANSRGGGVYVTSTDGKFTMTAALPETRLTSTAAVYVWRAAPSPSAAR